MYQIDYNYYKRNKKTFEPEGMPIYGKVKASTIKQLNDRYREVRDNHNVFEYTCVNFCMIREVKG